MAMDIHELNRTVIEEFRARAGKVSGQFEGVPLLLLTTVGARSGLSRTNPLAYFADGDRYVIIASYAGAPINPPWFYNLKANAVVEVEMGTERFQARAEVMNEPERTDVYQKLASAAPIFAEYQSKTSRTIPVVVLQRHQE
jgi:deazaflavin-dependent oxidoreductase (nitroreductase family)